MDNDLAKSGAAWGKRGRSKATQDIHKQFIMDRVFYGYNTGEIVDELKKEFGLALSRGVVSGVISDMRITWRDRALESTNSYINQEIDRLNSMEREAWNMYKTSGGVVTETQVEQLRGHDDEIITTRQLAAEKDMSEMPLRWFREILKIQTSRRKLLKLEATFQVQQNVVNIKAYTQFDPGREWPDPPLISKPEDCVIDGDVINE